MEIDGLKVVITGAASGMGRHFALRLAADGAHVAACDMNDEGLQSLAAESQALKGVIRTYVVNVADEDNVCSFFDTAWQDFDGLNALINNAGIFRDGLLVKKDKQTGEIKKMSLKQWQQVIDVDLTGPFLCARELVARVVEKNGGPAVIVNMSSVARHGNLGQSNYSAAKAGLVADTETWAKELARYGIRVGAIAPGFVDTPILQGMRPEVLENLVKAVPLRRVAHCDEILAGVKFIIECDYFTGRCIDIDGGMRI